ncbi:helix-turn-helix transcriptional regulator [Pseudomonas spirodelae]|uniref:Helix-turn-helix domain-containing protein n=1 Tax=Pseudomonas spirodelae TaxID=3101751 RepID=A0ABU5PB88_9PSED|nr:helix-turn-helix domain-containing protein [Pseudomonas sp. T5W1]MEA1606890.1 helix-turn-helix domain-containing protein [Pseudomonas sp. T5W1]
MNHHAQDFSRSLLLSKGHHPGFGAAHTDLLTTGQVADFLGMSPRTLAGWRARRWGGPAWVKCGSRVRYRKADVMAWLEAGKRQGGEV